MAMINCMGCGGSFADIKGPTHRYMESCPGCWAAYGEVLAREYSDPAYFQVHRLTVDAYAVQHPGQLSAQSIQSVAVHLIRLCLLLEQGLDMPHANAAMLTAVKSKGSYTWLAPPPSLGSMTIADVHGAKDAEEHKRLVRAWAASAWSAWSPHHETIHRWLLKGF
ncbi:MAG TPA: DUF5946 family protein [Gammaproteobacteria bacterium]|nr:DUF5946 family protein [Gammaproteobacteria bacterium]